MLFEGLIVCERKLLRLKSRSVGFLAATSFTDCLREVEPEGKKKPSGKKQNFIDKDHNKAPRRSDKISTAKVMVFSNCVSYMKRSPTRPSHCRWYGHTDYSAFSQPLSF